MDSLDSDPCFVDDLLNFSSDMEEEEEKDNRDKPRRALASTSLKPDGLLGPDGDSVRPFHGQDFVEEELEWISNKDAFPAVESFVGILPEQPSAAVLKLHSPVSVLDDGSGGSTISSNSNSTSNCNSSNGGSSITTLTSCFGSLKAPRRARSKRRCRRRRGDVTGRQLCWSQANNNSCSNSGSGYVKEEKTTRMTTMGRKCQHCGADKTPQWRAGPYGPKTLCNACGVRYKSGRLVPEYRPASSPSFSNALHSNSHRKILEMRRSKLMMGMVVKQPLGSG